MNFGERFKLWREYKRIKLKDLARDLGVSYDKLRSLEESWNGDMDLLLKGLSLMQLTYNDFSDGLLTVGQAKYSWRQRGASDEELREFQSQVDRLVGLNGRLAQWYGPKKCSPQKDLKDKNNESSRELAQQLVCEYKLGDYPAKKMNRMLRSMGVLPLLVDAPRCISGAAVSLQDHELIMINTHESEERRNFDTAHELFHVLTRTKLWPEWSDSGNEKSPKERLANTFAAELLMPTSTMKKELDSGWKVTDGAELRRKAEKFNVSYSALAWRLYNLSLIKTQDEQKLLVEKAQDTEKIKPKKGLNEKPELYNEIFFQRLSKAFLAGRISVLHASKVLGLTRDDLRGRMQSYGLEIEF